MAKKIDLSTEITLQNNCHGSFYFEAGTGELAIDLEEYGSDGYVTFGELKKMVSRKKKILEEVMILITYVDSDELTIADVAEALRLTDTYNELLSVCEDDISIEAIQDWIVTSTEEDFSKKVKSKKSKLRKSIIDTTVYLYRKGEVTDFNKMIAVSEELGVNFAGSNETSFWSDAKVPETALHMIN